MLSNVEEALEVSIDSQPRANAFGIVIKVRRCWVMWRMLLEVSIDSQPRADTVGKGSAFLHKRKSIKNILNFSKSFGKLSKMWQYCHIKILQIYGESFKNNLFRKTIHFVLLYSIFYSGECSFRYQAILRIIHRSLAIENSFMRSLVRGTKQLSVYVRLDGD